MDAENFDRAADQTRIYGRDVAYSLFEKGRDAVLQEIP
jgi:hypothetical protein